MSFNQMSNDIMTPTVLKTVKKWKKPKYGCRSSVIIHTGLKTKRAIMETDNFPHH